MLIERTIIRFLYGRPLETLLATFGVSLVLQQLVRSVFSALNRSVATPAWMSGTLQINEALGITYNRLYIVVFTLIVFGLLLVVLKRTRLGLDIRAVSQNRAMARAMGIRSEWVDAMTFGLGSGIAGVAGVALSQLTNVGPEPRPGLHHRLVHGRGVRRRRQSLGHAHRRHVAGHRQQAARAVRRRGARQDRRARRADSLHPAAAARTVPADRPRGGERSSGTGAARTVLGDDRAVFLAIARWRIAVVVPILNLAVPASSPLHLSTYVLTLIGKYLCYAMLALAVDLVWGYCGILSLGHAAFFCARRLRDGHVSDAPDRHARRLRRSGAARLHGVPELEGAAVVLARLRPTSGSRMP